MERQAVNGERRRINWGDLLDEAWGKDEPLAQHATPTVPPDVWPTCDDCDSSLDDQDNDLDKENRTENDTNGAHKHTGTVSSVGREGKVATDSSFLPLGQKLFSELSKSVPSTERNRKWVTRGTGRRVRNTSRPTSKTKLQLKRSSGATTTTANKKCRKKLRQLCLDLGQKSFGHATCRACGMVYSLGHTQDEADHARFHRRYLSGISFHGWKSERVVEVFFDGRILAVFPEDRRHHLRKVKELCSLVDSELGLAVGVSPWRPTTKMYLYVSAAKKVMGCVFAERISEIQFRSGEHHLKRPAGLLRPNPQWESFCSLLLWHRELSSLPLEQLTIV
jgi:hypothetical protein